MTSYVALLRGINVGKAKRIAMADLRSLLEGLGHTDVSTYLQSGNALFACDRDSPDLLAAELEQAIDREFGMSVRCLVRRREDLQRVVDHDPFAGVATDPARYLVAFLNTKPDPALVAAIDADLYLPERFAVGEREVYTWFPEGVREAKLTNVFFEKKLGGKAAGVVGTARNWNTVVKLLSLLS